MRPNHLEWRNLGRCDWIGVTNGSGDPGLGQGKTATLRMIASAHPDRKILYLVFNRKAREEAEEKFPGNVRVRTVHSLAFEAKWKDHVGPFTVADMLQSCEYPR